jgi:peptidoglycan glycosyltransferase
MSSMDRRVTWVGAVLLLCFVLLFVQMNNLQVRQAAALNANPLNDRIITTPSPFFEPRGEIISADGLVLAESRPSHDEYRYLRVYPERTASMFSDITGYDANALAAAPIGVEGSYNYLLQEHKTPAASIGNLLRVHEETDNVYLTISEKLQAVAMASVDSSPGRNGGAVVAIDPRTGAILAMFGYPYYDPNLLSSHDIAKVNALYTRISRRDGGSCASAPETSSANVLLNPLCNFATEETNAPGSTMKVITSSAVYDHDPSIERQVFKPVGAITFPDCAGTGCRLQNYGGEICPPARSVGLAQILASSCDTAYAQIGDELGYQRLADEAHAFGFGQVPPIDLPRATASAFPTASQVGNSTAYEGFEAIGQYEDSATVLQMALVASAIANNGVIMAPHVVSRALNAYGETAFTYHPHVWLRATSSKTANAVRQLMIGVTGATHLQDTTAGELFSGWYSDGGPVIAAKTGTAEPGENTCGTYNWLIALGPAAQGEVPTVAVAAMIPVSQAQCGAVGYSPTGAAVAGPVLLPVLQAALAQQGS